MSLGFLLLEHLVAPCLEMGEPLVKNAGDAAIEPDGGPRQPLQQPAIMADQHDPRPQAAEFGLEPLDAGQVEMVGRFVQQQHVGFRCEHAGECGASRLAAGQALRILGAG